MPALIRHRAGASATGGSHRHVACHEARPDRPEERTPAPAGTRDGTGSLRTTTHGGRVAVHVVGELDLSLAADLRRVLAELMAPGAADVVVDLTDVTFVDSTGLGVLIAALRRARDGAGRLRLVVDREDVLKLLRITGLARVFTVHATLDAALAAFWPPPST